MASTEYLIEKVLEFHLIADTRYQEVVDEYINELMGRLDSSDFAALISRIRREKDDYYIKKV